MSFEIKRVSFQKSAGGIFKRNENKENFFLERERENSGYHNEVGKRRKKVGGKVKHEVVEIATRRRRRRRKKKEEEEEEKKKENDEGGRTAEKNKIKKAGPGRRWTRPDQEGSGVSFSFFPFFVSSGGGGGKLASGAGRLHGASCMYGVWSMEFFICVASTLLSYSALISSYSLSSTIMYRALHTEQSTPIQSTSYTLRLRAKQTHDSRKLCSSSAAVDWPTGQVTSPAD